MADLTSDELLELRDAYLVDRVNEAVNPKVYLSHYNRATRAQMFSDATLQAWNAAIELESGEELERIRYAKEQERLRFGDSDEDAATAGDGLRLVAKYRLIRARARRMQVADPGFAGSISDGRTRVKMLDEWLSQAQQDEAFARMNQGGVAQVPFLRR